MANKFTGKAFITGRIRVLTGMHIGGSKTALDIGGIDLNVIKTARGKVPFIPGSSLKGKLRTILAREVGSVGVSKRQLNKEEKENKIPTDENFPYIPEIFGYTGDSDDRNQTPTRLLVRDAFLCDDEQDEKGFKNQFQDAELTDDFTEEKWENTINRRTGTAEHPRQLERVPAGAEFTFEMVYNIYDDEKKDDHLNHLRKAMRILEEDYLGGHGSRGYGQIEFVNVSLSERTIQDYEQNNPRSVTEKDFLGKIATA